LPSIADLRELQTLLLEEMIESGKVVRFDADVSDATGVAQRREVVRVGVFNVISADGYLNHNVADGSLSMLPRQPASRYVSVAQKFFEASSGNAAMAIDPSRGALLSLVIQSPGFVEQVRFGGGVGYAIIVMGLIGLAIALVRLVRGELPDVVLRVVTDRELGLAPTPVEMRMSCDGPDLASLCTHLAATLSGGGARLDDKPELLFVLRGVRAEDLVERAAAGLSATPGRSSSAAKLTGGVKQLGELFGIELVDAPVKAGRRTSSKPARTPGSTDQPTRTSPGPGGQTGKIPRTASRPRRS
jgi:hypothetical protein